MSRAPCARASVSTIERPKPVPGRSATLRIRHDPAGLPHRHQQCAKQRDHDQRVEQADADRASILALRDGDVQRQSVRPEIEGPREHQRDRETEHVKQKRRRQRPSRQDEAPADAISPSRIAHGAHGPHPSDGCPVVSRRAKLSLFTPLCCIVPVNCCDASSKLGLHDAALPLLPSPLRTVQVPG